ncbi:unnamed protein product [Urochloa decumbens]|uniref:Uncharacterized protein n=1 Tax=Urochloa decumbens TaxID=240449 RepID=A0ABC8WL76_9POAL
MDETSSRVALIVPAPAADPDHAQQQGRRRTAALTVACASRVFVIALMGSGVAPMAWRARRDPVELAVVAGPCALLAALFLCQHRAERLAPDSPPGERRRLHVAALVLSTLIFGLVAYQLSRGMPAAQAIALWSLMCVLVLAFFYVIVLRKDPQYQELGGVDRDADAGDDRKAFKTARPTDDLV